MTMIIRDIMLGNDKLNAIGRHEEAIGRNAIAGGFQGQRMWTDYMPNGDFAEAITNSSFNWNGKKEPLVLATENDTLNGVAMLFETLLEPSCFHLCGRAHLLESGSSRARRRTQTGRPERPTASSI